ncbi:MAG TPA: hypothetical protein VLA24_09425 [Pseudomonadales bacterium]|nr:hypothetical protein [Pseudomonadales bacterium]
MAERVYERTPYWKNNPYTCPILMLIQGWIFWRKWHFSDHSGWRLLEKPRVIDRCRFPVWMIKAEHKFWRGYMGILVAKKYGYYGRWGGIGGQERQ